jgi:anti-anti-sigma regulatory factor
MILKLEGAVTIADARLLEEICNDLQDELRCAITIDLSGVNFLGSQSAEILCRLKSMPDLEIDGAHLFVQQIIESVENRNGKPHE